MINEQRCCGSCNSQELEIVLALGETPIADKLLRQDQLNDPDPLFPLNLAFCRVCALLQLTAAVPPEQLYDDDYPYYSSVSKSLVDHFADSANSIIDKQDLDEKSLVLEIASNDGYMLKNFSARGIPVLGIDPASGPAQVARDAGIPTRCAFFNHALAKELAEENQLADVVLGNNVLNLVPDLDGFLAGVKLLLKPGTSQAVFEVPYAVKLIEKSAFDNIFHQNIWYFTLTSLQRLLARNDFYIHDVQIVPTFGGSLRVYFGHQNISSQSVNDLLASEGKSGVDQVKFYQRFAEKVETIKRRLLEMLVNLKIDGKRLAVYGAAGGMATTMLSYVGIDNILIDYAIDANPYKQGRYTTGSRLKIFPPSILLEDRPDVVLLLAWNYAAEIFNQHHTYREEGGKFILPIPAPVII
jgi:SAM-dependent methyltransferase